MAASLTIERSVPCGTIDCSAEDQLDLFKSFLSLTIQLSQGFVRLLKTREVHICWRWKWEAERRSKGRRKVWGTVSGVIVPCVWIPATRWGHVPQHWFGKQALPFPACHGNGSGPTCFTVGRHELLRNFPRYSRWSTKSRRVTKSGITRDTHAKSVVPLRRGSEPGGCSSRVQDVSLCGALKLLLLWKVHAWVKEVVGPGDGSHSLHIACAGGFHFGEVWSYQRALWESWEKAECH